MITWSAIARNICQPLKYTSRNALQTWQKWLWIFWKEHAWLWPSFNPFHTLKILLCSSRTSTSTEIQESSRHYSRPITHELGKWLGLSADNPSGTNSFEVGLCQYHLHVQSWSCLSNLHPFDQHNWQHWSLTPSGHLSNDFYWQPPGLGQRSMSVILLGLDYVWRMLANSSNPAYKAYLIQPW